MPRAPVLQKIQRLRAAHFADRDTIWAEAKRRAYEIGERGCAVLGAQGYQVRRGALELAGVLDQHHPVAGLGDFREERVDQGGLAGRGPARNQDVPPLADAGAEQLGLQAGHDAGLDIVAEGEDRDGRPPDGEAGRGYDRRDKPFEPLPRPGQLGGDARRTGVNLDANMMRDEPHDAFGVGWRDAETSVLEAARQPVDPKPAVWIQHHLDDAWIFEKTGNRLSQRGAQHARAAGESFGSERDRRHVEPRYAASVRRRMSAGSIRKGHNWGEATRLKRALGAQDRNTGREDGAA